MTEECPRCKLTLDETGACPRCEFSAPRLPEQVRETGLAGVEEARAALREKSK